MLGRNYKYTMQYYFRLQDSYTIGIQRPDNVAKIVHYNLTQKYLLINKNIPYKHNRSTLLENEQKKYFGI